MHFYKIPVSEKNFETKDSVSLHFKVIELPEAFTNYHPGQHLTLKLIINGKEYRRSYSMSSAPGQETISISIKKVDDGIVSNYIFNKINAGDQLELSGPEGHFFITPDSGRRQNYYFFAAGSGITPIFSMIQSLLEDEPMSMVYLLYGNRTEEDIMFHEQLIKLSQKYQDQFFVEFTLSRLKGNLLPFLSSKKKIWEGWKGRINKDSIQKFFNTYPLRNLNALYYLCGPGDFIESTKENLLKSNIDSKSIHAEYFTIPVHPVSDSQIPNLNTVRLIVHLNNKTHELQMPGNRKILDSILDAKLDAPYSCSSGACSTCMAKIIQGKVHMDVSLALEPEEIEQGYILTCQSRPLTELIEIKY